jgi:2'-5' RNA ligase
VATVIVAVPPVDDRVNKISSEKVPHLTLLFLGDADLSAEAVLYVQHACKELSPFGLSVDYRGTLGEDDADVLFFKKRWEFERIAAFRHHLLLNDEIKRAHDAAPQFPEWTPHLTLGYPETPAKSDNVDNDRVHWVDFDRIAVWTGDYEGPEFRLEYEDRGMDVAMSDISTVQRGEEAVDELFHFGVKGMRWGVRKGDYEGASRAVNKQASKDAEEFARAKMFYGEGAGTRRKLIKAKVEAASRKDPTYKKAFEHHLAKQDLGKHASKARKERRRKDVRKGTAKTARGVHRELNGGFGNSSLTSKLISEGIRAATHGDSSDAIDFSSMTMEDALAHYGVKGMRWGVRKAEKRQGQADRAQVRADAAKKIADSHKGKLFNSAEQRQAKKLQREADIRQKMANKSWDKVDKKWMKENTGLDGAVKLHNAVADRINNGELDKFNNEPRWKKAADDGVLLNDDHPETKAYFQAYMDLNNKLFVEEAIKLGGSPSGRKFYEYREDAEGNAYAYLATRKKGLNHAEGDTEQVFEIVRREDGTILAMGPTEVELKHYGVKGMRWGVIRERGIAKANRMQAEAEGKRAKLLDEAAELRKQQKALKKTDPGKAAALGRKAFAKEDAANSATLGRGLDYQYGKGKAKPLSEARLSLTWRERKQDDKFAEQFNKVDSKLLWKKREKYFDKKAFEAINSKPEYANLRFDVDSPELTKYRNEVNALWAQAMTKYIDKTIGTKAPSGTKTFEYRWYPATNRLNGSFGIHEVETGVKHADQDLVEPETLVVTSSDGYVVGFIFGIDEGDPVEHSEMDFEETLAHYGVKGMRWGVRKDESASRGGASSGPTAVVVTQKKPGKFAKASGGKGHPLSDDARTALELRQKAKASTTDSLSNAELQKVIARMNLENQYHSASFNSDRRSAGARFAAGLFGQKRYGKKRHFTDPAEDLGELVRKGADAGRQFDKDLAKIAKA